MSRNSESGTRLRTHNMHFEIALAPVSHPHKTIVINLDERQVSKQIHSFINIA